MAHTISELRTLKTKYGQALKDVTAIHEAVTVLLHKYSGSQAREYTKDPGEAKRILGIKEALKVITNKKDQLEAMFSGLKAEYRETPKYERKKTVAPTATLEDNGIVFSISQEAADKLHSSGLVQKCDNPECVSYHPVGMTLGELQARIEEIEDASNG